MNVDLHLSKITEILESIGERVEGNLYCDISPKNVLSNSHKIHNIEFLARNKQRICEIGFNAGHSALFMINANSNAEYYFFDIGLHSYVMPCFTYLSDSFPNTKMKIHLGDSCNTLPVFADYNEEQFDLCHIDGGHTFPVFSNDYKNCMKILKKGGILVFDDFDYPEINQFVHHKVEQGEISFFYDSSLYPSSQHAVLVKN